MTQDMIEMAKKAGIPTGSRFVGGELVECLTLEVQRFANLVAANAKAEEHEWLIGYIRVHQPSCEQIANAIRARGEA